MAKVRPKNKVQTPEVSKTSEVFSPRAVAGVLAKLNAWRKKLASTVSQQNPELAESDLNALIQGEILDAVAARLCTDRGIDGRGLRQAISGNKVSTETIVNLRDCVSTADVAMLPITILGRVYERLQENESRLVGPDRPTATATTRRKKTGVYYTPDYVVDYIVRETVGRALVERDGNVPSPPAPLPRKRGRGEPTWTSLSETRISGLEETAPHVGSIRPLRVLDPACGAGSFLLGIYQFLLDWNRDRYIEDDPERHARGRAPRLFRQEDGQWRLTLAERRRILLESVFGVDLDPQAVAIAKASLVLQMLDVSPPRGRVSPRLDLPDSKRPAHATPDMAEAIDAFATQTLQCLAKNIRCGDSLSAFDWQSQFSEILAGANGGFDVVVGNPPYRRELGFASLMTALGDTPFGKQYRSARMNLWYYFLHRGMELLQPDGWLSFIVNAYWTSGSGAERLTEALRSEAHVDELFLLGGVKVFPQVAGRHMILRVQKRKSDRPTLVKRLPQDAASAEPFLTDRLPAIVYEKESAQLFRHSRIDAEPSADRILAMLERWPPLGDLGQVRQGIAENPASINAKTNARFGDRWNVGEGVFALREDELRELDLDPNEQALLRPYYDLCDVSRWWIAERPSLRLIYSTPRTCPDIAAFPRLKAHLERFRPIMAQRRETAKGTNRWWQLHWPRDEAIWRSAKIVCLQFARRPSLVPVYQPSYVPFSMNVFVPSAETPESIELLCALLNSRLLWKWHQHHAKRRGVGLEINGRVLARSPIRRIDFDYPADRTLAEKITRLGRKMGELARAQRAASAASQQAVLARRFAAADQRLDRLVYTLYGLTEEEMAVVERSTDETDNNDALRSPDGHVLRVRAGP